MTLNLDIPTLHGFNAVTCLRMAQASLEAYDLSKTDGVFVEKQLDLRVRIEDCGPYVIVAFRGTASLQNWLVDAYAVPNKLGIHSGFYSAWISLLGDAVGALAHYDKPIYLTGHSLGGALAVVASRNITAEAIYTFGQPRVCRKSASMSNAPLFRIVDKEDIVPHIPGLLAGYRHRGDLIFFTCVGTVEFDPPVWKQLFMHAVGLYSDVYRFSQGEMPQWVAIKEHEMKLYYNLIATMPARYAAPTQAPR